MTELSKIGENNAIAHLARKLGPAPAGILSVGDDTAVVPIPGNDELEQILTSDAVIEGKHYFPGTEPERVGRKAINRVLSDIAAMGGTPSWLLVNVVAPPSLDMDWLDAAYDGMIEAANGGNALIVGGDLAPGDTTEFHVFGVGKIPKGNAVLRSGAHPTDLLMVTGALGGSIHGKHLDFTPRLREGRFLRDWATSMMDLSDGLATDLRRLCERSEVGALIHLRELPIDSAVNTKDSPLEAWQHALFDGEDYELLFTISSSVISGFTAAWHAAFDTPCSSIGILYGEAGAVNILNADNHIEPLTEQIFQDYARHAFATENST